MIPASSAIGMKFSGAIIPRVGWHQRTSASKPITRLSAKSTCG
jgi:hypothetical protein